MAWIRMCGEATKPKAYIYNQGTWSVPYENPGAYRWAGNIPVGFTLQADKMTAPGTTGIKMVGTTNMIDVTPYTELHIRAKVTAGSPQCVIATAKENSGVLAMEVMSDVGVEKEYVLNVALLNTSGYIFFICSNNIGIEVYELWLT